VFNATAARLGVMCPQKALIGGDEPDPNESGEEAMLRVLLDHPSSELNRSQFGIPEYDPSRGASTMAMGTEDCLVLNINTPFIPEGEPEPEELLPVVSAFSRVFLCLDCVSRLVIPSLTSAIFCDHSHCYLL